MEEGILDPFYIITFFLLLIKVVLLAKFCKPTTRQQVYQYQQDSKYNYPKTKPKYTKSWSKKINIQKTSYRSIERIASNQ